jgi:hypothetical protein
MCVALLSACALQAQDVSAFTVVKPISRTRAAAATRRLYAKPPPKNSFDLEAIEAFEQQLDGEASCGDDEIVEDLLLDDRR